jgi:hypothetical protein
MLDIHHNLSLFCIHELRRQPVDSFGCKIISNWGLADDKKFCLTFQYPRLLFNVLFLEIFYFYLKKFWLDIALIYDNDLAP